jgi:hypothetical protein
MSITKSANPFEARLASLPRNQEDKTILVPRKTQAETDRTAGWLSEVFKSDDHRPLFLAVSWQLPEGTIHRIAGTALECAKTSPIGYFIKLAKEAGYRPPRREA